MKKNKEHAPSSVRTYDKDGFRRRASCVCVKDESENEVLLVSRPRQINQWIFPGGGIEPKEDPRQAASREVMEEAGVIGSIVRCLGVFETEHARTCVYVLLVSYELSEWDESIKCGRKRMWFKIEDAKLALGADHAQLAYITRLKSSSSALLKLQLPSSQFSRNLTRHATGSQSKNSNLIESNNTISESYSNTPVVDSCRNVVVRGSKSANQITHFSEQFNHRITNNKVKACSSSTVSALVDYSKQPPADPFIANGNSNYCSGGTSNNISAAFLTTVTATGIYGHSSKNHNVEEYRKIFEIHNGCCDLGHLYEKQAAAQNLTLDGEIRVFDGHCRSDSSLSSQTSTSSSTNNPNITVYNSSKDWKEPVNNNELSPDDR